MKVPLQLFGLAIVPLIIVGCADTGPNTDKNDDVASATELLPLVGDDGMTLDQRDALWKQSELIKRLEEADGPVAP